MNMNHFYRIFISGFLALLITFQGGVMVHACACLGMHAQQHPCCPEQQQEQQKPPCPHHQKTKKQGVSVVQISNVDDCNCEISSTAQPLIQPAEELPPVQKLVWAGSLTVTPVQELDRRTIQKPIWLRQLYYPDKASHYIKTVRLLI